MLWLMKRSTVFYFLQFIHVTHVIVLRAILNPACRQHPFRLLKVCQCGKVYLPLHAQSPSFTFLLWISWGSSPAGVHTTILSLTYEWKINIKNFKNLVFWWVEKLGLGSPQALTGGHASLSLSRCRPYKQHFCFWILVL